MLKKLHGKCNNRGNRNDFFSFPEGVISKLKLINPFTIFTFHDPRRADELLIENILVPTVCVQQYVCCYQRMDLIFELRGFQIIFLLSDHPRGQFSAP